MSATASSSSSSSFSSTSSSGTEFLPKVDGRTDTFRMVHANGSSCEVNLLGATITSWKLLGQEMLFVSDKAIYAPGKAIRGGIPVVFPQFGPGKLPQHGFARNQIWTHEHVNINKATGEVHATFSLSENEETLKVWPYKFQLQLLIILKASSLSMQLRVTNTGTSSFDFTTLLHTYFHVADISVATVAGLNGKQYIDKVNGGNIREEKDQVIRFNGEVDRVYIKGAADGNSVYIGDGGNCDVMVKATGFTDFVVWNPWIEKSKGMADMQTDGYHHFVCVEAGCVVDPITLEAGATWEGAQGFSLRVLGK